MTYVVLLLREGDGYSVRIPGKPGGVSCISDGETRELALENVRDALMCCLDDEVAAYAAEFDVREVTDVEEFLK